MLVRPIDTHHPVPTPRPTFYWRAAIDPDPFQTMTYTWQVSSVPSFVLHSDSTLADTSLQFKTNLALNKTWYWRVYVTDPDGRQVVTPAVAFRTYTPGDIDGNTNVDIGDLTVFVDYLFLSAVPMEEPMIGDLNGDCQVDIVDLTRLIDNLFLTMTPLDPACGTASMDEPEVTP